MDIDFAEVVSYPTQTFSLLPTDFNPSTLTPIQVLMVALLMGEEMSPERLSNFSKLTQQDDHRKLPGFRICALDLLQMLPFSRCGPSHSCHSWDTHDTCQ